jgi:hypothetical protein
MDIKPSGLLAVYYSDDAENWTQIVSDVFADSEVETEAVQNELTNQLSQSGEIFSGSIQFLDFTDKEALQNLSRGSGKSKRYLRFMYDGGIVHQTTQRCYISVTKNMNPNRRDGDMSWILEFELAAVFPYLTFLIGLLLFNGQEITFNNQNLTYNP